MGVPMFGAYMLIINISSWGILSLINTKWSSLSFLTNFSLKSTLSDMSSATPVCLWGPFPWKTFFYPLILSQCSFLSVRWVSCKQHMIGLCFLTLFIILCLLIGALRPWTFLASIERCMFIQQYHSWGYTQRTVTQVTPEAPAHPCLFQHYSQ
jgi:hypothetical protein